MCHNAKCQSLGRLRQRSVSSLLHGPYERLRPHSLSGLRKAHTQRVINGPRVRARRDAARGGRVVCLFLGRRRGAPREWHRTTLGLAELMQWDRPESHTTSSRERLPSECHINWTGQRHPRETPFALADAPGRQTQPDVVLRSDSQTVISVCSTRANATSARRGPKVRVMLIVPGRQPRRRGRAVARRRLARRLSARQEAAARLSRRGRSTRRGSARAKNGALRSHSTRNAHAARRTLV